MDPRYKIVSLPKKSGGSRTIYVPSEEYASELRGLLPALQALDTSPAAHGFHIGRSTVTAARLHRGYQHTVCWDLRSFFDTVTEKHLGGIPAEVLDVVLVDGAPRQGLPTSPTVANIAAIALDEAIAAYLDGAGCAYTRYADDLTISTQDGEHIPELLRDIPELVRRAGFEISVKKTRVQHASAGRRVICGVAVDDGDATHATRTARRRLRAAEHRASLPVSDRERAAAQAHGLREWCRQQLPVRAAIDERTRGRGAVLASALQVREARQDRAGLRARIAAFPVKEMVAAATWLREFTAANESGAKSWAVALAATFGPAWRDWIRPCGEDGNAVHDACYWLPSSVLPSDGLGARLLRWRREIPGLMSRAADLEAIAKAWSRLSADQRTLPFRTLLSVSKARTYPRIRNAVFAALAADAGTDYADYRRWESRWLLGVAALTHDAIPHVAVTLDGYTLRVLDRDDPRGLWAGTLTACCQHPDGQGSSCAWHGATDPDGAIAVVEDSAGNVIAQSWMWRSGDVVVADNCEALGGHETLLPRIYGLFAAALVGRLGVAEVRIGATGDLEIPKTWAKVPAVAAPAGCYSDAAKQHSIARCA